MISKDGTPIGMKKFDDFRPTVGSVLSRNRLAGCTMVFGKELMNKLKADATKIIAFNKFKYGHDAWLLLYAVSLGGKIYLDKDSHIAYRRHGDAASSAGGGMKKRMRNELRIFWNKYDKRRRIASFLLDELPDATPESRRVLSHIAGYRECLSYRGKLLFSGELTTNLKTIDLKNFIAVLIGRY